MRSILLCCAAALVLAACSDDGTQPVKPDTKKQPKYDGSLSCGPGSCGGCCTKSGQCIIIQSNTNCGANGAQCKTCTGGTVFENLESYAYPFPENSEIIKTLEEPFGHMGGIAVLRGNLAPDTAISKPGAIDPALFQFSGRARVFDSEEKANEAILQKDIHPGDVVVIRYEGPKGGPGMREMYKAMKYLYGLGLNKSTALITDGRFSGTNNGCFVGHISPEAAEGGSIAIVQDGDEINIDVEKGTLELEVSSEEIQKRFKAWKPPSAKFKRGYLELYSRLASSAAEGAVIKRGIQIEANTHSE